MKLALAAIFRGRDRAGGILSRLVAPRKRPPMSYRIVIVCYYGELHRPSLLPATFSWMCYLCFSLQPVKEGKKEREREREGGGREKDVRSWNYDNDTIMDIDIRNDLGGNEIKSKVIIINLSLSLSPSLRLSDA